MNRQQRRAEKQAAKKARKGGSPEAIRKSLEQDYAVAVEHHREGRFDEAEVFYRKVLSLDNTIAPALLNLGMIVLHSGRFEEALELTGQLIAIQPDNAGAYNNKGSALHQLGLMDEAISCFEKSIALKADDFSSHNNLGNVLTDSGAPEKAIQSFRQALKINPQFARAHYNLGIALMTQSALEDALLSFRKASVLDPALAEAQNNMGVTLQKLGRQKEAAPEFQKALATRPDYAEAHYNLGVTLEKLGRSDAAEAHYQQALAINPDYADAHFGMSTMLLNRGDLKRGWAEYEWRGKKESNSITPRQFPQARWNGEPLQGKSILLWGEQGIGDEIRFASIIPDAIAMAADCAIECEPRLVDLFARSFPGARIHAYPYAEAESGAAAFDYQISTPSLALHLRKSIADFPKNPSYLVADQNRRQHWRARIDTLGDGLKVGVSWRSHLFGPDRRHTFATIADLKPLLALKDAVFINLQYGQCADEIAEFEKLYGVPLHTWDDIDLKDDIDDAMALSASLDVVVTLLSTVCEMSGSLGVPTYIFHPPGSCPITLGTDGIAFHPSARLFKRRVDEDWQRVLTEISGEIAELKKS